LAHLKQALALQPASTQLANKLAWFLATCPQAALRDGPGALQLAVQLNAAAGGRDPNVLRTLAAAYAQCGRYPDAAEAAGRGIQIARQQRNASLVASMEQEVKIYQAGRPYGEGK
jgi:hypothetical protein